MSINLQYIKGKNNIIADIISRSPSSHARPLSECATDRSIKDAMKVTPAKKG